MITYVPLPELTDEHWFTMWQAMHDPELVSYLGGEVTSPTPDLISFYQTLEDERAAGNLILWGIIEDDRLIGSTMLSRTKEQWEVGTILISPADRGTGKGVRAAFYALDHAFSTLNEDWVLAFTNGSDPHVRSILKRGGFRPLFNFLCMSRDYWFAHHHNSSIVRKITGRPDKRRRQRRNRKRKNTGGKE